MPRKLCTACLVLALLPVCGIPVAAGTDPGATPAVPAPAAGEFSLGVRNREHVSAGPGVERRDEPEAGQPSGLDPRLAPAYDANDPNAPAKNKGGFSEWWYSASRGTRAWVIVGGVLIAGISISALSD